VQDALIAPFWLSHEMSAPVQLFVPFCCASKSSLTFRQSQLVQDAGLFRQKSLLGASNDPTRVRTQYWVAVVQVVPPHSMVVGVLFVSALPSSSPPHANNDMAVRRMMRTLRIDLFNSFTLYDLVVPRRGPCVGAAPL
jgi:hypothetical protein